MKFYKSTEKIISKKKIAENIFFFDYTSPLDFEWKAGQYIGVGISGLYRRSYSVWDVKDGVLTLLIDTKPGGLASQFFDTAEAGMENLIIGPYGKFVVQENNFHKVFISTGTGIAPFYSMAKDALNRGYKVTFIFGVGTFESEIAYPYFKEFIDNKNFKYVQAVTRNTLEHIPVEQDKRVEVKLGRVTTVVPELNLDYANSEFYICGGPQMVDDMENVLRSLGADKILHEKYSP
ncbi:MAG: FAD-dependent oxidoreductase [Candidatus Dojkabacteria bacterium]